MTALAMPFIPVAWGELVDKLTILEIKGERLTSAKALESVRLEYSALDQVLGEKRTDARLRELRDTLRAINAQLWEVEDLLREHEAAHDFGDVFVHLARSVYRLNDQRAAVKRHISLQLNSEFLEEKSYASY
jgi:hypothetical protein